MLLPTTKWNKSYWMEDIENFNKGNSQKDLPNETHYGDRWGNTETDNELKTIIEKYITPFLDEEKNAIEIGPGGGRLTKYLQEFKTVYLVDLNPNSFDYIKKRFNSNKNFRFCLNNGNDFPEIPLNEINFVFSFGTFVHIDLGDIVDYFCNLIPKLSNNASIILQYSEKLTEDGKLNESFAPNSRLVMKKLIDDFGFEIQSEVLNVQNCSNVIHFIYNTKKQYFMSNKKSFEEIINFWHNKILKRYPDNNSLKIFQNKFEQNKISENDFVFSLLTSDEYKLQIESYCKEIIEKKS